MKSKKNLLELLKPLPYFSKNTIFQFTEGLGLTKPTVDTYIGRFLRDKEIIQLKRGFYVSSDFFNKNKSDISYSFCLANIIREPSYVTSWTALQYYDLATEAIYSIISVTPRTTRSYQIKAGNFSYHSIDRRLFSDFVLVSRKFDFFIASPAKALFDLLYFRTSQFRSISVKDIRLLIDDLRIDIDEMDKDEQNKFYLMIKKYE